jgi:hypothetical protein
MAVTNMSIIEKDDLIKKMPRDALKEELRNPSGNFPLFLVAARLKEVEEMELDMMARHAAQQSSQEGESVAARLAQQAMPESPMSEIGANPAPQPRPDSQGIMAQQIAGPTQPLPTVMARRGLQGKYPGESSGIDQEVLAAAVQSRRTGGAPRLYNQGPGRKVSFEKTGKKGAAPASQIPALFGLASALAKTEERAYGGMETLPPFQVESGALPMGAKGFTAPARSVGSKMPEDSGLAYVSKLLESMGSPSKDKPTVFAKEGFTSIGRVSPRYPNPNRVPPVYMPPQFMVRRPPISRPGPASLPYASELDSVPEGYEQKIARLRDAERLRAARAVEEAEIEQGDLIADAFAGAPLVSPPASPGIADAQMRAKNIAINRGVLPSREQAANHWPGLDKLKEIGNRIINPQKFPPLLDKGAIEPAVEGASAAIRGGVQTVGNVVSDISSGFANYPSEVAAAYNLPNKLTGGDKSRGNVEFSLPKGSPSDAQAVYGPGGVDRMLTAAAKADASEASGGSASTSGIAAGGGGNDRIASDAADVTGSRSGLAPMRLPTETTVTRR